MILIYYVDETGLNAEQGTMATNSLLFSCFLCL